MFRAEIHAFLEALKDKQINDFNLTVEADKNPVTKEFFQFVLDCSAEEISTILSHYPRLMSVAANDPDNRVFRKLIEKASPDSLNKAVLTHPEIVLRAINLNAFRMEIVLKLIEKLSSEAVSKVIVMNEGGYFRRAVAIAETDNILSQFGANKNKPLVSVQALSALIDKATPEAFSQALFKNPDLFQQINKIEAISIENIIAKASSEAIDKVVIDVPSLLYLAGSNHSKFKGIFEKVSNEAISKAIINYKKNHSLLGEISSHSQHEYFMMVATKASSEAICADLSKSVAVAFLVKNETLLDLISKFNGLEGMRAVTIKVLEGFDKGNPSEALYHLFENKKKEVFQVICDVKDRARRIELLKHALDEKHSLGKLFYMQRKTYKPSVNSGTLKLIQAELVKEEKLLREEKGIEVAKELPSSGWGGWAFWKRNPTAPVVQKLEHEKDEKNDSHVSSGIGFQDQL